MTDIEQLEEQFGIEGELGFSDIDGNLVYITVSNKYADAEICLYGAHVMHFRPVNTFDMLWMSPASEYEVGKPIRGGIPVCFPWFSRHPSDNNMPIHGFARLMYWDVIETASLPEGETLIRLQLSSSESTLIYWPYHFQAEIEIIVGKKLEIQLKVRNTGNEFFDYSCALHTYYRVSAIENIFIEGLHDTSYFVALGEDLFKQEENLLKIQQEINRRYINTENDCLLHDPVFHRTIRAAKRNSKTTVVWNPWENSKNFNDIPEEGYETFVCIEAVNTKSDTVNLKPGEENILSAIIGLDN